MINIKRNFEKLILKHKSFINLENVNRPLLCIFILGTGNVAEYKETSKNITENKNTEPEDISLDGYMEDVEEFIIRHDTIGEDFFYPIAAYMPFIPWIEAIIGCPVYAGKNYFYPKSFIDNLVEFEPEREIDLSEKNKWFKKLIEVTEGLVKKFGDIYPVASSAHLRGPADVMLAALGSTVLPVEMNDNPGKIKKFASICTEVFIRVAKKLNEITFKAKFYGYTTPIYGIWTENVCQYYQDDALALLSPRYYKEFILENHLNIEKNFPSTIFSVHGNMMFVIDDIINYPSLKIVQTHREIETIGPTMKEMLPKFKLIQEHKKALIINFTDVNCSLSLMEEEIELISKELSNKGLCIYICAKDIDDGLAKSGVVKKVFKMTDNI